MKALTLWQSWASAIALGFKRVENRPWAPPLNLVGQRIAIHAGKAYDYKGEAFLRTLLNSDQFDQVKREGLALRGVILCTVRLDRAVLHLAHRQRTPQYSLPEPPDPIVHDPMFVGPWGWILSDVQPLKPPMPAAGKSKLWTCW